MELKFLGLKLNLETMVVSILLVLLICYFTTCSCTRLEGFDTGAPLDYTLGEGVPNDRWSTPPVGELPASSMYASLAGNEAGAVPLPEDQLAFFYDNKFSPSCCYKPQQYSSSSGCACMTESQMKYLSSRGGNNNLPSYARAAH